MRQTFIEMRWTHTPMPIHIDHVTAVVGANDTIIARKTKSMDLRLHWLQYREA